MEERVGGYLCKTENGREVKVYEYQELIDVTTASDTRRKYVPGLKRLALEHGGAVNFVDDSTFEIVATGEKLTVKK